MAFSIPDPIKIYVILGTIIFVVGSIGGLIWYIVDLKDDVVTLQADNKTLNKAVDTQQGTIKGMQDDFLVIKKAQDTLRQSVNNNNTDLGDLRRKFEQNAKGKPRDIGVIATKNPTAVTRVINNGTAEANRCLEIASGSPLTEKEKNAKLKSEINTVCPNLANPNYRSSTN